MEEIAKRKGTFCSNFLGWLKTLYYIYFWILLYIYIKSIKYYGGVEHEKY